MLKEQTFFYLLFHHLPLYSQGEKEEGRRADINTQKKTNKDALFFINNAWNKYDNEKSHCTLVNRSQIKSTRSTVIR